MAGDLSTSFDACQHKSALEVNYGWRVEGMAWRTDFTEKIKTARRLLVIQRTLSLTHACSAFNRVRWSKKKNRTSNKIAKQRLSHAVDTKQQELILFSSFSPSNDYKILNFPLNKKKKKLFFHVSSYINLPYISQWSWQRKCKWLVSNTWSLKKEGKKKSRSQTKNNSSFEGVPYCVAAMGSYSLAWDCCCCCCCCRNCCCFPECWSFAYLVSTCKTFLSAFLSKKYPRFCL